MLFIVHIKSFLILGRSFPHEYIVLPSAKLQISDFSTKKKISLMNILNVRPHVIGCARMLDIITCGRILQLTATHYNMRLHHKSCGRMLQDAAACYNSNLRSDSAIVKKSFNNVPYSKLPKVTELQTSFKLQTT